MSNLKSKLKAANVAGDAKKSKSTVPCIEGKEALADRALTVYEAFKDAKSEFDKVEGEVLAAARAEYARLNADGSFSKSMNFVGKSTDGVQIRFQDRFTNIPDDKEDMLKAELGDNYSKYFEDKRDIALNNPTDEVIESVMKQLGEETFFKLFKIKVTITAKSDMDRKQFGLPETVRAVLTQYKPSVVPRPGKKDE